jgi:hypothetical protein
MLSTQCHTTEETRKFAEYLKEEKRIRQKVHDPSALQDSIKAMQKRYSLNINGEISKLYDRTEQWPLLLRTLKRE